MRKTFLVARYEFLRHVIRPGFLLAIFGFPLLFIAIGAGAAWFFSQKEEEPVGIVDPSHILLAPERYDGGITWQPFSAADEAQAALDAGIIQAYFVMPATYNSNQPIDFFHNGDIYDGIYGDFRDYLRISLLQPETVEVQSLFADGRVDVTFTSLSEAESQTNPLNSVLPYIFGIIMAIGIFTTAGYLIQAVVDEKENRTMEILITSIRPFQLIAGKIIGLVSLSFVQMSIWLLMIFGGILWAGNRFGGFPELSISPTLIIIALAWFIPFYITIAGFMTAIGVSVTEASEGQQTVGLISMMSMFPLWLIGLIINAPDSPLAVFMSLFPFSSFLTILMRWSLTEIPVWQYVASWLLLASTAFFSVFMASKLLNAGMLQYTQKIKLKEVRRHLFSQRSS